MTTTTEPTTHTPHPLWPHNTVDVQWRCEPCGEDDSFTEPWLAVLRIFYVDPTPNADGEHEVWAGHMIEIPAIKDRPVGDDGRWATQEELDAALADNGFVRTGDWEADGPADEDHQCRLFAPIRYAR